MMKTLLILTSLLSISATAPLANYDQRQEGELNVKVDLDNFVIVVARPTSSLDLLTGMASLFSDAKRAATVIHSVGKTSEDDNPEDKSKNLEDVSLDKDPPIVEEKHKDEAMIVLVKTATAEEKKNDTRDGRTLREVSRAAEKSKSWLSSKYKFVDRVDEPQHLKLIGEAIEACGPGRSRDRFGICKQDRSD